MRALQERYYRENTEEKSEKQRAIFHNKYLPCRGKARLTTALFVSDAALTPMKHSTVDCYLAHLLRANVSAAEASRYSFHSFRVGFACCLLAAGCPYDMIQALAR